jgi:hypothetical protein
MVMFVIVIVAVIVIVIMPGMSGMVVCGVIVLGRLRHGSIQFQSLHI